MAEHPIVPRLWPGATVVCLGSGPSLCQEDVGVVRGKARVIAINTSYRMAPWADVLYAGDTRWWEWHKGAQGFTGLKFTLSRTFKHPDVVRLRRLGEKGLSLDPTGLAMGKNSGYAAINLAVHLGASRIVLLGYDMQPGPHGREHWHDDHPVKTPSPYVLFRKMFDSLVQPLAELQIEVVNCSRVTALTCFPRRPLREVFAAAEVAA